MAKAFSQLTNEIILFKDNDIGCVTQDLESKRAPARVLSQAYNITSQEAFNAIIERVIPAVYKIKDGINAIYIKKLAGGYKFAEALTSGDTYGSLKTNECSFIQFEPGAYIDSETTRFYIRVDTAFCVLNDVWIKGDIGVPDAVLSYFIDAEHVTCNRCIAADRNGPTSPGQSIFLANWANANVGKTVHFNRCIISNIKSTGTGVLTGIYNARNVSKCVIRDINTPSFFRGTYLCKNIEGLQIQDVIADQFRGISSCSIISNSIIENITVDDYCHGIYQCEEISNCYIDGMNSNTGDAIGLLECKNIPSCAVSNISSTSGNAYAYSNCEHLSINNAYICDIGFIGCKHLSDCKSEQNGVDGFNNCESVKGCKATNNTTNGFTLCKAMQGNRSTANGTNYSATCYADWAGTIAVADTATGGYNG